MTRFTFSLQGVLEAKRRQEDAAKGQLALLQARKARTAERLARLDRLRREQDHRRTDGIGAGAGVAALLATQRYTAELGDRIDASRQVARELSQQIRAQRERLVDLMKDRKCLETLRERRLAEHRRLRLREQYDAIDDMIAAQQKDPCNG